MFFAITSPIIALILWLGYRKLKRIIQDKVTQFSVRLNKEGFDYYEFAKEGGTLRNSVHLNLNDIENIRHTYAPARGLPHDILVIKKDGSEALPLYTILAPIQRQQVVDWLRDQLDAWRARH
jgi:hypothetical protein